MDWFIYKLNCYKYVFISRAGFNSSNYENVSFITLKDIYFENGIIYDNSH